MGWDIELVFCVCHFSPVMAQSLEATFKSRGFGQVFGQIQPLTDNDEGTQKTWSCDYWERAHRECADTIAA